jgi:glycerol-3-phosphate acyltransferase PlsY
MDSIPTASWLIYLLAALAGYLIGSVPFPRILHLLLFHRMKKADQNTGEPGTEGPAEPPIYSATFVGTEYGKQYGCLTSILDMLKVILPTLAARMIYPGEIVYLVVALFAIVGNNFPIFNKFKGGAGYSAVLGAVLVINWFGVFIANAAAMILGYLLGSVMIMRVAGNILYIVWFWIWFNDIYYVGFMVLANAVFWLSVTRHLRKLPQVKKKAGDEFSQEYMAKKLLMGGKFGYFIDEYGFPALLRKFYRKLAPTKARQ